jgi:hypothetical protein
MFIGPPGTDNGGEREKKKERIQLIMMMTWDIEWPRTCDIISLQKPVQNISPLLFPFCNLYLRIKIRQFKKESSLPNLEAFYIQSHTQ